MYSQAMYCLDRVLVLVAERPKLRERQPFKTITTVGDQA